MSVTRENLLQYLRGQQLADERVIEDDGRRLQGLSPDAARAEYDSLCDAWYSSPYGRRRGEVDEMHLEGLLAVRRAMTAAHQRRQGAEPSA